MAVETIDFNKVIQYSKKNCFTKSQHKCAQYVKDAFKTGGCSYITGNGWSNQNFCKTNGFELIGDFVPIDKNPRAHGNRAIQFPEGYVQQTGDICLIKHGSIGHICYATGAGINDWVSDYFQKSPGQMNGTGPYCYTGSVERVQFWRHSSVLGSTPVVTETPTSEVEVTEEKSKKELRQERRAQRKSKRQGNTENQEVYVSGEMEDLGVPNIIQCWSDSTDRVGSGSGTILGTHIKQN